MKEQDSQISGNILKLIHHESFLKNKRKPISAQLILTNRCNLKCCFCCNQYRGKHDSLTKDQVTKTLYTLAKLGCKGVEFTGGSEPTVHSFFPEAINLCHSLGMKPALVTNGVLLHKIPKEVLSKLDWIRISINASKENYKKIHGFDFYDDVMKGLEKIVDMPISNKGISYIFCDETPISDVQNLLDDLQNKNLDYFRFSVDIFKQPEILNFKPNFNSSNLKVIYHSDRDTRIPEHCRIFYYKPVIDCTGLIYPCCTNMHKEIHPLGKIGELESLFNNDIELDTGKCHYCIYGDTNDLIYQKENNKIKNIDFI